MRKLDKRHLLKNEEKKHLKLRDPLLRDIFLLLTVSPSSLELVSIIVNVKNGIMINKTTKT